MCFMLYPRDHNYPPLNVDPDMTTKTDSQNLRTLKAVTAIFRMINAGQSLGTTLDFISEQVARQLRHKFCAISLYDSKEKSFEIKGSYGLSKEYLETANEMLAAYLAEDGITSDKSVTLRAFATQSVITIESLEQSWEFDSWHYLAQKAGYQSAIFLPLQFGGEAIGAMACYDDSRTYDDSLVASLTTVSEQASTAVGLAHALHAQEQTIQALEHHAQASRRANDELRQVSNLAESITSLLLRASSFEDLLERVAEAIGKEVTFHHVEPRLERDGSTRTQEVFGTKRYGYVSYKAGPLSEEFDTQLLRQVAALCALHFSREEATLERELRRSSDVLLALLDSEKPSADQFRVLLKALKLTPGKSYRIGVLRGRGDPNVADVRRRLAEAKFPHAPRGDSLLFLAPVSAFNQDGLAFNASEAGNIVLSQGMVLYASKPTQELEALHEIYRETLGAIHVMEQAVTPRAHNRVIFLEDWPVLRLAVATSADAYLEKRIDDICGVLRQPRHTELRQTVIVYFMNNLSKSDTARLLHLHVNTVKQRLQKVEELLGLSFKNLDDLFELRFALFADAAPEAPAVH